MSGRPLRKSHIRNLSRWMNTRGPGLAASRPGMAGTVKNVRPRDGSAGFEEEGGPTAGVS